VEARGWRDIGYNFLVDRFGRIWEGRWGGVDKAVVGAHTLGYNEVAFAMSAIGNFEECQPPQAVLDAYAKLFAWKLSKYDIKADATKLWVKDRYLQAINGHRDVGQTACPGRYLYATDPEDPAAGGEDPAGHGLHADAHPDPHPEAHPDAHAASCRRSVRRSLRGLRARLPARSDVLGSTWPDLFVRDKTTGRILVVPTEGQFRFTPKVLTAGAWTSYDAIVAPGDLTGDGKGDLFVRNRQTHEAMVPAGQRLRRLPAPDRQVRGVRRLHLADRGRRLRQGRQRRPGGARRPGSGWCCSRARAGATFRKPVVLAATWSYHRPYGVGDFDQDGRPDLVANSDEGTLRLFPGLRTSLGASLGTPQVLPVSMTGVDALLGGGDYNADGLPDLVLRQPRHRARSTCCPAPAPARSPTSLGPFRSLRDWHVVSGGQLIGKPQGATRSGCSATRLAIITGNGRRNVSAHGQ
jgi:hypothetical protein